MNGQNTIALPHLTQKFVRDFESPAFTFCTIDTMENRSAKFTLQLMEKSARLQVLSPVKRVGFLFQNLSLDIRSV